MRQDLRKQLIAIRRQQSTTDLQIKNDLIFHKLIPYLQHARCVGVYKSMPYEVDTDAIIRFLLANDKRVGVPKCEGQGIMHFYEIHEETQFHKNNMQLLEPMQGSKISPADFDLMLVPMVGFCGHHRLGYGKGYYDRYLRHCDAYKIGLAFACQKAHFQAESFDVPMDLVIYDAIEEDAIIQKK